MTGDIVIENGDQIAQALQPVLEKLAITGSQFWDIYVGYIQMNTLLDIVALAILVITTIGAMKFASDRITPDSERSEHDEGSRAGWTAISGVVWFFVVGFTLDIATDCIIRMICPEYFAIQSIISQIGGLV
jgi:hypothetical protein